MEKKNSEDAVSILTSRISTPRGLREAEEALYARERYFTSVTFACGHAKVVCLWGHHAFRDEKMARLQAVPCPDCSGPVEAILCRFKGRPTGGGINY